MTVGAVPWLLAAWASCGQSDPTRDRSRKDASADASLDASAGGSGDASADRSLDGSGGSPDGFDARSEVRDGAVDVDGTTDSAAPVDASDATPGNPCPGQDADGELYLVAGHDV